MLCRRQAVNHHIQLVSRSLQRLRHPVDILLLLDLAGKEARGSEFLAQFLDRRLGPLILIRQQQVRALAHERLRDGVRDAPLVPNSQDDCRLAFQ